MIRFFAASAQVHADGSDERRQRFSAWLERDALGQPDRAFDFGMRVLGREQANQTHEYRHASVGKGGHVSTFPSPPG
jgi:hypothetical protein